MKEKDILRKELVLELRRHKHGRRFYKKSVMVKEQTEFYVDKISDIRFEDCCVEICPVLYSFNANIKIDDTFMLLLSIPYGKIIKGHADFLCAYSLYENDECIERNVCYLNDLKEFNSPH